MGTCSVTEEKRELPKEGTQQVITLLQRQSKTKILCTPNIFVCLGKKCVFVCECVFDVCVCKCVENYVCVCCLFV